MNLNGYQPEISINMNFGCQSKDHRKVITLWPAPLYSDECISEVDHQTIASATLTLDAYHRSGAAY